MTKITTRQTKKKSIRGRYEKKKDKDKQADKNHS
jgi:hypothetical protein